MGIDGLSIGNFIITGWEYPIDCFRKLVGPDVAIYAYADHSSAKMDGLPNQMMHLNRGHQRGFAAGCYANGADGVGVFNWYWGDVYGISSKDYYSGLGEMKAGLDALRIMPRNHFLTAGITDPAVDLPVQVPVTMSWSQTTAGARRFDMVLAAESPDATVFVNVIFDGTVQPHELWLQVNDRPVGCANSISEGFRNDWQGKPYEKLQRNAFIASFQVPYGVLIDGYNKIVVRLDRDSTELLIAKEHQIDILGIEVKIS